MHGVLRIYYANAVRGGLDPSNPHPLSPSPKKQPSDSFILLVKLLL